MSYQVMKKNEAPETGYSPVGKAIESYEDALGKASEYAADKRHPGRVYQVESEDGRLVVSVAFVPGEVTGVDDEDNVVRGPAKLVITTDSRYAETKIDSEGNVIVGTEKGKLTVEEVEV